MKHLLFICSGAIDRSPCAASLFDDSETHEAKFAGVGPLTETPVTKELIDWADLIVCMEFEHKVALFEQFSDARKKDVVALNIPNTFLRYDHELEKVLREKLEDYL